MQMTSTRGLIRIAMRKPNNTPISVVFLAVMAILLAFGACIVSAQGERSATNALPAKYYSPSEEGKYRLQVGDVVDISVLGNRDTNAGGVPIAPDGNLYYKFVGKVPAAGRLPEEIAADIEGQIGNLFNSPRVSVLPTRFSDNRYYIYGKVEKPGTYPLDKAVTVREAIAIAGGLAQGIYRGTTIELASLSDSYLSRDGKVLPIDFKSLVREYDEKYDIYLRPGDIIYISSGLSEQSEVYLLGAVNGARASAYSDGMTLMDLLAGATERGGGLKESAHTEQIAILRGSLEEPDIFEVNLEKILKGEAKDVYLTAGDIVYVPEKPFKFARTLGKSIVSVFVKTFASNLGEDFVNEVIFPGMEEE